MPRSDSPAISARTASSSVAVTASVSSRPISMSASSASSARRASTICIDSASAHVCAIRSRRRPVSACAGRRDTQSSTVRTSLDAMSFIAHASTQPAAASKSPAASACLTASGHCRSAAYHALARRCSAATAPGSRSASSSRR
ncbi:hypothetical protein [Burkholderia sp. AU32262]|uniref:hypothetical protein n=1 Tax=Burkholderia sp. AU32262 TaxID=2879630 RepID=UPI001CF40CDF|nr:hypothetical protein [Burkholderia sp. AU32262]MCA8241858.1 hypothetical protein [Burkholderia sp. AU32262]